MILKKKVLPLVLLLLFHRSMEVRSLDSVAVEQLTAAANIPLSCLQTYLEDKDPSSVTRKKALATMLASVVRLANCYCQQVNNADEAYFVGNEHRLYLGWAFYDVLQLLSSCYNAYAPVSKSDTSESDIMLADNILENVAEELSTELNSTAKLTRQVLSLAEGASTLIASMYSAKVHTKNIRSICYSLSSCLRLGKQLLSQNTSTQKRVVGILLILNSIALMRNIIEDKDMVVLTSIATTAEEVAPVSPTASSAEEEEPLIRRRARTTARSGTRRTRANQAQTRRRRTQEVVEERETVADQPTSPHSRAEGAALSEEEEEVLHSEEENTLRRRWDAERKRYVTEHEPWRRAYALRTAAQRHK